MKEAVKRGIIAGVGVILQIMFTLFLYMFLIDKLWIINILFGFLKIIITVGLIKNSKNYSSTLPWIILLLLFPVIGTLMYIIIEQNKYNSRVLKNIVTSEKGE